MKQERHEGERGGREEIFQPVTHYKAHERMCFMQNAEMIVQIKIIFT